MSTLMDKLKRESQAVSSPMGFRATPAAVSKPKMLLIASLAQADLDSVADHMAGADAGLLDVSKSGSGAEVIREVLTAAPDIPWGGRLKDGDEEEITQIVNAGCDFVVFPASSTAWAILQREKVGKILEVAVSLDEGLLRAIDKLSVDAVLLGGEQEERRTLTWHQLMQFQRCADLFTKPLLASVPSNVTASGLQALWVAGVDGVVVEVGAGQPAGKLMELRLALDKATLPSPRKRGPAAGLVAHLGGTVGSVSAEPEEE